VKSQLLKYLDALQRGSCAPVENQKIGDVNMVTFSDSEFGPGYHSGSGDADSVLDTGGNAEYALVVNGHSLVHALDPRLEKLFLDLAGRCMLHTFCKVKILFYIHFPY